MSSPNINPASSTTDLYKQAITDLESTPSVKSTTTPLAQKQPTEQEFSYLDALFQDTLQAMDQEEISQF